MEEIELREDMSEDMSRKLRECIRQIKAFKKQMKQILAISIIIPLICCVIFYFKMQETNHALQDTTNQLEELKGLLQEQQTALNELREESTTREEVAFPVEEVQQEPLQETPLVENDELSEVMPDVETEAAHKVYLTFDDGPSEYTDDILDILDQYEVKATFFVVGKEDEASREMLQQIVDRGHSLGMHSFSHDYGKIYESVESFEEDLLKIRDYLYEVTGVESTLYRFPGGSSNSVSDLDMQLFADCLRGHGITFYDWNISSGDGGSRLVPVEELLNNCTKDVTMWDTSVVLMHDAAEKKTTVQALPGIIENILAMEDTVILPITGDTKPVQHIQVNQQK